MFTADSTGSVERRHPARDMHVHWTEDTTFIIEPTYHTPNPAKRYSKTIELSLNPVRTSRVAEPPKLTSVEEPPEIPDRPSHPLPSSDIFQLPSPTSLESPSLQQLAVLVEEPTDADNETTQHTSSSPSSQTFHFPGPKEPPIIMETTLGAMLQAPENTKPLVVQPIIAHTNVMDSCFTMNTQLQHEKVSDGISNEFVNQQVSEQLFPVSKKTPEPTTSEDSVLMPSQLLSQQVDPLLRPMSQQTTSITTERQCMGSQSEGPIVTTPQLERCTPRPMSQQVTLHGDQCKNEIQSVESTSKHSIISNQQAGDYTECPVSLPKTAVVGTRETDRSCICSPSKVSVVSNQQAVDDMQQTEPQQKTPTGDQGETGERNVASPSNLSVVSMSQHGDIKQRPMSQSNTSIIEQSETVRQRGESPANVSVVSNQQSAENPLRPLSQQITPAGDQFDNEEQGIKSPSTVSVVSNQPSIDNTEKTVSPPKTPAVDQFDIKSPSKCSVVSTETQREALGRPISPNSLLSDHSIPLDQTPSGVQSRATDSQPQLCPPPSPAVYDPDRFCRSYVTADNQNSVPPSPVLPENAAQWYNQTSSRHGFDSICEFCGGFRKEKFTAYGIILGIFCFPCGLVCCFKCRETRCTVCGR